MNNMSPFENHISDNTLDVFVRVQKYFLLKTGTFLDIPEEHNQASSPKSMLTPKHKSFTITSRVARSEECWLFLASDEVTEENIEGALQQFVGSWHQSPKKIVLITSSLSLDAAFLKSLKKSLKLPISIINGEDLTTIGDKIVVKFFKNMFKSNLDREIDEFDLDLAMSEFLKQKKEAEDFEENLRVLTPRLFVTPLVVAICSVVFLIMWNSGVAVWDPTVEDLFNWGGVYPGAMFDEIWRLVTSEFVHGGLWHIVLNMYALIGFGALAERLFGTARFAFIYAVSILGASLASVYFNVDERIVSVGASGAICGVIGSLAGFICVRRRDLARSIFRRLGKEGLGVLACLGVAAFNPMIDNYAHLGGLVTGFLCGCLFARPFPSGLTERGLIPVSLALVICCVAIWFGFKEVNDRVSTSYVACAMHFSQTARDANLERYDEITTVVRAARISRDNSISTLEARKLREKIRSLSVAFAAFSYENVEMEEHRVNWIQAFDALLLCTLSSSDARAMSNEYKDRCDSWLVVHVELGAKMESFGKRSEELLESPR